MSRLTAAQEVERVKTRWMAGELSLQQASFWDRFWRLRVIQERKALRLREASLRLTETREALPPWRLLRRRRLAQEISRLRAAP